MGFQKIVNAIAVHPEAKEVWSWNQIAFVVYGDGKECGRVGHILNNNPRYWKTEKGMYKVSFLWDEITKDELLPFPTDRRFLKLCKKIYKSEYRNVPLNFLDMADLIWGEESTQYTKLIAQLLRNHQPYYKRLDGGKVRFNWKIIFQRRQENTSFLSTESLINNLITAVENEYRDSFKAHIKSAVEISDLHELKAPGLLGYCYSGTIQDQGDDEGVALLEGMPVIVQWGQNDCVSASLLVYDPSYNNIVLKFNTPQICKKGKVFPDMARLLKSYLPFIKDLDNNPLALSVLKGGDEEFVGCDQAIKVGGLNPGQINFLNHALNNNVCYLWGPPGTGKTSTFAKLIKVLVEKKKRILVVSISNKAVDEITLRFVTEKVECSPMRLGFASKELLENKNLFPHREATDRLLKLLRTLDKQKTYKSFSSVGKAQLIQEIKRVREEISHVLKKYLSVSDVIFTTVAQVSSVAPFQVWEKDEYKRKDLAQKFDYVICDEVSMMNITHLIPCCALATEGVIMGGDDKQLGPVVLSQSKQAQEYLHQSMLEFERRFSPRKQRIVQLREQHRMHPSISNLISQFFYDGILKTSFSHKDMVEPKFLKGPLMKCAFFNVRESITEMTLKGSRKNERERDCVVALLDAIVKDISTDTTLASEIYNIGIITPYRAQAGIIRKVLRKYIEATRSENKIRLDQESSEPNSIGIKIGTVHAFQGGEADLIIWSLVDSEKLKLPDGNLDSGSGGKPGRLYKGIGGERLANVAISRAKHGLYVVGSAATFINGSYRGKVSCLLSKIAGDGRYYDAEEVLKGSYIPKEIDMVMN